MGLTTTGFKEFSNDLIHMANSIGSDAVNAALEAGAEPIRQKMLENASWNPKKQTGTLYRSILTLAIKVTKKDCKTIWIGVPATEEAAYYAGFVEFGHGGTLSGRFVGGAHPTPPHPFVIPAYNACSEEAYQIIRNELQKAFNKATRGGR